MRLGRRQIDVLRAAAEGRAHTRHAGQGRMVVSGLTDTHPDEVLERLLELELVVLAEHRVGGHDLGLTAAGRAALRSLGMRE